MKVSDWIVSELVRLEVKYVFTLPGGFSSHLNDSIAHSALTPVYMLHESGAAFAACGYAQYTGGLAVLCVTSGPGCTNALTGVASAWDDSIPLLVISGEARLPHIEARKNYQLRQGGPQDVDINRIARPIVKYINVAENGEGVKHILEHAVRFALEPRRGPAWLIVPLDVQAMEMEL